MALGQDFVKRHDRIGTLPNPHHTSAGTSIRSTADILQQHPRLYWAIREEAVADERLRVKRLATQNNDAGRAVMSTLTPQAKTEGEQLMEHAALRRNQERRARGERNAT
jgi:hypothetical protein